MKVYYRGVLVKHIKLQQILVCSAIAITLPAAAATNPAGATPPFNPNPATSDGQDAIKDGNTTATGGTGNPNGASGNTPAPPAPVANESIKDAVVDCPLQEYREEAFEEAMRVASIVPDIDAIFNAESEASAGCFAASSKVINLAMEIPSVSFSLTGIGDLVKKNLERMLMQKAEEVLNKGCAIADQALLGALDPLQKYFDEYAERANEFNGMIGNFEMGAEYEGSHKGIYDNASDMIKKKIAGTQADIDAGAAAMNAIDKAIADKYREDLAKNPLVPAGNGNTNSSPANTPSTYSAGSNANARMPAAAPAVAEPTAAPTPMPTPAPARTAPPVNNTTSGNPFSAGSAPTSGSPF